MNRAELTNILSERILILDGGMGSMIQQYALNNHISLNSCNDMLCITNPDIITDIHNAYLDAGADIISTCSFNANALSLAEYGLEKKAFEINRAAAMLARKAADLYSTQEKKRFVAGSMGPTAKCASISPDMNDLSKRSVSWDELENAYYDNARGLVEGGVDLLLLETVFDTLNAKAAIAAIARLSKERCADIPLMISATISDAAGRLLSGQTIEAFVVSVAHANPISIGLNCSLGAQKLLPYLKTLAAFAPYAISCHPNAGLPDHLGAYNENPQETASYIKIFFEQSLVNIIGGCCGTTPAHIAAIADLSHNYKPRVITKDHDFYKRAYLAGIDVLALPETTNTTLKNLNRGLHGVSRRNDNEFIPIGERCNVAGSRKFLRLIQSNEWDSAASLAREMTASGAHIIDVCMDDALIDGKAAMLTFLHTALSDPQIARCPVMPDSSRFDILQAALKCIQGKSIVNSISLKEGEDEFIRRAKFIQSYGAAAVVMLFDEKGQALTYRRKIEIAERSYKILVAAGFPGNDIVFDPNVLTIATGMSEHDSYALDFIRACAWIKQNCPGVHISAGVSNLSFSFRGNDYFRNAMHAVFLHHAVKAGLSMAIVNPASLVLYEDIPIDLKEALEDAILNRNGNNTERLLALSKKYNNDKGNSLNAASLKTPNAANIVHDMTKLSIEDRITQSLIEGLDSTIALDVAVLCKSGKTALQIIEGPLMKGMEETGSRFAQGKMFLPQVIRSARVMKKAVEALEPYTYVDNALQAGKIVLATVKGDVHDIGKNIVSIILGCNGYEIIDLGVMVPAETIIQNAIEHKADCVGLSGLISPSLDEMVTVAQEMEKARLSIPLLIGGAAASLVHTALRIKSVYSGPVVYVRNAGEAPGVVRALLSPQLRDTFLQKLDSEYKETLQQHQQKTEKRVEISLQEARANRLRIDWNKTKIHTPVSTGIVQYNQYDVDKVIARLKKGMNTGKTKALLEAQKHRLSLRAVAGFFPALSENESIFLYEQDPHSKQVNFNKEIARFDFPRNIEKKENGKPNECLADHILPKEYAQTRNAKGDTAPLHDWLGLFALTAEFMPEQTTSTDSVQLVSAAHTTDKYDTLLLDSLANALAEAFCEELHHVAQAAMRPAFGYPACPNHADKKTAFALLEAESRIGLSLTETCMIVPASSICGMYFLR